MVLIKKKGVLFRWISLYGWMHTTGGGQLCDSGSMGAGKGVSISRNLSKLRSLHTTGGYTRHSTVFHRTSSLTYSTSDASASVCSGDATPHTCLSSSSNVELASPKPDCQPPTSSTQPISVRDNASSEVPDSASVVVFIASFGVEEYLGPQPLESIADVISTSVGPSGRNSDYLLNLAEAARTLFPVVVDDHLFQLEKLVRQRLE